MSFKGSSFLKLLPLVVTVDDYVDSHNSKEWRLGHSEIVGFISSLIAVLLSAPFHLIRHLLPAI